VTTATYARGGGGISAAALDQVISAAAFDHVIIVAAVDHVVSTSRKLNQNDGL